MSVSTCREIGTEELFELIFQLTPDAMIAVGADGRIAFANAQVEGIFGYDANELAGRCVDDLLPKSLRARHKRYRTAYFENPSRRSMGDQSDLRGLHKSGRELFVDISLNAVDTLGGQFVLAAIRDVSELRRTNELMRRNEQRFHAAASSATDLIWEATLNERRQWQDDDPVNWIGDVDRMLGYAPGEFPHTIGAYFGIIHPDDGEALSDALERSMSTGHHFDTMYRVLRKDGSELVWEDRAQAIMWKKGKPVVWVGAINDVTERITAEQELKSALASIRRLKKLTETENISLKEEIKRQAGPSDVVGKSDVIQMVLQQVQLVAQTDATVLLLGETGTGKGLIAQRIHRQSQRSDRSFVKIDCGAIPPTLIESELFGHEKGAFTGATVRKLGQFEVANGGTIFLDEIGDMPKALQGKLLRAIQDREVQRVGSTSLKPVDVRVIAATNHDLQQAVKDSEFRSDLYYRLAVFPIVMPPLRDRPEDIPLLAAYMMSRAATSLRKKVKSISKVVKDAMAAYDWPGNIRELRNAIERAMILSTGETLTVDLTPDRRGGPLVTQRGPSEDTLVAMETRHITSVLERCDWKIRGTGNAAEQLGLNPSTLRSRMKKLKITRSVATSEPAK